MVHADDRLPHEQARVGEQLVGLVHGARLRVLERYDAERGFRW